MLALSLHRDNDRGSDLFGNRVEWIGTSPHERDIPAFQSNPAGDSHRFPFPAPEQGRLVLEAHDISSQLEEYRGPKRWSRRVHFCSMFD
ncbi:hypothetical protein ACOJBO_05030 [Rhizobium beringeri]